MIRDGKATQRAKGVHKMDNATRINDPLILAIETATRAGSVAVAKGGNILSSRAGDAGVSHSTNLIELIEQVLQDASAQLSDIDLFAAAVGPGSFTGLRIGLATVKALANCTGRKVSGVSTLDAIAHAAGNTGDVVSLLPAGRGEVFAQRFATEKGSVDALDTAAHLSPPALLERYGAVESLTWAGDGARQQIELLTTWARDKGFPVTHSRSNGSGWKIIEETNNLAEAVAALALKQFEAGKSSSADELHAVYVRASDAEINERWQQEKARP
jgi:tRNA threonylcarbamoyladenosine biosynthesis protein TsaB